MIDLMALVFSALMWGLGIIGALILLFALGVGGYRGIKVWFRKPVTHTIYGEEAVKAGLAIYKDEPALDAEERLAAFKDGALWGWAYYHGTDR